VVVGAPGYARLRVGVGAAENSAALREHVLEEFSPEEMPAVEDAVRRAADAVESWVAEGALAAMSRFNRKVDVERPSDPTAPEQVHREESET